MIIFDLCRVSVDMVRTSFAPYVLSLLVPKQWLRRTKSVVVAFGRESLSIGADASIRGSVGGSDVWSSCGSSEKSYDSIGEPPDSS